MIVKKLLAIPRIDYTSKKHPPLFRSHATDAVLCFDDRKKPKTVLVAMHPTETFLRHYLLEPMAERGVAMIAADTRFTGEDTDLVMEYAVLDIGQVIKHIRECYDFENIVLLANCGGGAFSCYYQAQAENPTVTHTPSGEACDFSEADLIPTKGIVLLNAHSSRAKVLTDWMDPAVISEDDPFSSDPDLDMYNPKNGPPYSEAFMQRYRQAQRNRNHRITDWAKERLEYIRSLETEMRDCVFNTYRTYADPRFLDVNWDPSDRKSQKNPKPTNYSANSLATVNTLRCWLSTWGLSTTLADGPGNLAKCSVPSIVIGATADRGCWASYTREYYEAARGDKEMVWIKHATHYFVGQPELMHQAADTIVKWLNERDLI